MAETGTGSVSAATQASSTRPLQGETPKIIYFRRLGVMPGYGFMLCSA